MMFDNFCTQVRSGRTALSLLIYFESFGGVAFGKSSHWSVYVFWNGTVSSRAQAASLSWFQVWSCVSVTSFKDWFSAGSAEHFEMAVRSW